MMACAMIFSFTSIAGAQEDKKEANIDIAIMSLFGNQPEHLEVDIVVEAVSVNGNTAVSGPAIPVITVDFADADNFGPGENELFWFTDPVNVIENVQWPAPGVYRYKVSLGAFDAGIGHFIAFSDIDMDNDFRYLEFEVYVRNEGGEMVVDAVTAYHKRGDTDHEWQKVNTMRLLGLYVGSGTMTVTKTVEGDYADVDQQFVFAMEIHPLEEINQIFGYDAVGAVSISRSDGSTETLAPTTIDADGVYFYAFTLAHNESVHIDYSIYGTSVVITEDDYSDLGFETTINGEDTLSATVGILPGADSVSVVNTLFILTPTGIAIAAAPGVLIAALAVAVLYFVTRKKNDIEEYEEI